jgi:hypothetical protein
MRLKLISCEIFYREMCLAVSRSINQLDAEFLPKGLHDLGREGMFERIQQVVDAVDESHYEANLFGYGLCNNGLTGLTAKTIPMVIPRAHDCITLFLGSRQRYREYFDANSGVYFKTSGWIEREKPEGELSQLSVQAKTGMTMSLEDLVEKYGEENARYLYETLHQPQRNYGQFTYIEMGIEPDHRFERQTREAAERQGWKFDKVQGDMSLIQRLVDGPWDDNDFLVLQPGWRLAARFDEDIIQAEKVDASDR